MPASQGIPVDALLSVPPEAPAQRISWYSLAAISTQLALFLIVVHRFHLESAAFFEVAVLASGGFVVHALLPLRWRLPFFVCLSIAGVFAVLGPREAVLLLLTAGCLIAIARAPLTLRVRGLALVTIGAGLALARQGYTDWGWHPATWQLLASMFMFRLALYMYALRFGTDRPTLVQTLAYFLMLPNICFPLFPVVDYGTFDRSYYQERAADIYQRGICWIVRGTVHLVLYRFVYLFTLPASEVADLGQLVRYLLTTILLYLQVSGTFHVAVGMLHLFGFRLPETHRLYFLASSFTDFWRRINVYWKDFMLKVAYYPVYFRLRGVGQQRAVVAATLAVFATTWMLHSYQAFWIRGDFPVTGPDLLFWGLFAILVVANTSSERRARTPPPRVSGRSWSLARGLRTLATFAVICGLWSLWSADSIGGWLTMWSAARVAPPADIAKVLAAVSIALAVMGWNWDTRLGSTGRRRGWLDDRAHVIGTLTLLLLASRTELYDSEAPHAAAIIGTMKTASAGARDDTRLYRGYYEELTQASQLAVGGWEYPSLRPQGWGVFRESAMYRHRPGTLLRNDLAPATVVVINGVTHTSNRWGMRDRDYAIQKQPDTYRIALLGPSFVMGSGVPDKAVFERIAEEELNASLPRGGIKRVEILNFGMDGHSLLQQSALLRERVDAFRPDMTILTVDARPREWLDRDLLRVVQDRIQLPVPRLAQVLDSVGLGDVTARPIRVPFAAVRRLLATIGIETGMPVAEMETRLRQLPDTMVGRIILESAFAHVSAHGGRGVVLGLDVVTGRQAPSSAWLDMARRLGFETIDLFGVYDGHDPTTLRVNDFDHHPNVRAHELIAADFLRKLRPMLDVAHADMMAPADEGPAR